MTKVVDFGRGGDVDERPGRRAGASADGFTTASRARNARPGSRPARTRRTNTRRAPQRHALHAAKASPQGASTQTGSKKKGVPWASPSPASIDQPPVATNAWSIASRERWARVHATTPSTLAQAASKGSLSKGAKISPGRACVLKRRRPIPPKTSGPCRPRASWRL